MAIIAMTTSNSIRVKALRRSQEGILSLLTVGRTFTYTRRPMVRTERALFATCPLGYVLVTPWRLLFAE